MFNHNQEISRNSSLSDSELNLSEIKPKHKRKKRKSKLMRFKRCVWAVTVVRKMLRTRYRKRKLLALNRSLYFGLGYQSSPRGYGNDSSRLYDSSSQKSIKSFKIFFFLQILFKRKSLPEPKRRKTRILSSMTPG